MADMGLQALLFFVPVVFGILLLWISRRDRRQRFIQNRLDALIVTGPATSQASLTRLRQQAATFLLLPQRLRTVLDASFEATGHTIRFLHLPIVALISAALVFVFTARILALNPIFVILASAIVAVVAPVILLWMGKSRYQRRFLDIFPDALDLVGRAVKAGLPVNEALLVAGREVADPVGNELRRAFDQVQIGVEMIDALQQAADRIRVPDFRFMVVALALQQKTGGSLAETLNNLSTVIRARKALRLKARSLSAEAKVSSFILALLPFVVGGMMYLLNRDLMNVLITDHRGRFMVGVAFLSLVTGVLTMTLMVKRAMQ